MSTECVNCGAEPRWRDAQTGAHRCMSCLIAHGGGRPHACIPGGPGAEVVLDDTDPEAETTIDPDNPIAIWDALERQWGLCPRDEGSVEEFVGCLLEQGTAHALELLRSRQGVAG